MTLSKKHPYIYKNSVKYNLNGKTFTDEIYLKINFYSHDFLKITRSEIILKS